MQWGSTTTYEHAVLDATGRVLQSGDVKWASTNTLNPAGTTPLLAYTSLGKLTSTFVSGSCPNATGVITSCKYAKSGTVTKGADTLWIRGVMPTGAYATSVVLVGLEIKYGTSAWTSLDFLDSTSDGAYIGFSDPLLANGFSLRYSFGYFNNVKYTGGTYAGGASIPAFEFIVGKYATPLDPNLQPGTYSADPGLFGDIGPANMMGVEMDTAAVPEPASWAMLVAGFGVMGGTLRRRRVAVAVA
ncbi:PEP-CTERM sorting domain-containing protein [Polymorphobacter arshaanensis]|uniref:PEP-CTERM sorting domain-containing protein n=2 Tax=Glacieibacterium arshaanense TaxID=2511025 RepID=A0A4Y9EJR4_9SPHN|nr:PEP-CTERM sorting domain-containing protein [Polymorphobacter arshaanensis]